MNRLKTRSAWSHPAAHRARVAQARAPRVDLHDALDELQDDRRCVCIRFGLPCPALAFEIENDVDRAMGIVPGTYVLAADFVSPPLRSPVFDSPFLTR